MGSAAAEEAVVADSQRSLATSYTISAVVKTSAMLSAFPAYTTTSALYSGLSSAISTAVGSGAFTKTLRLQARYAHST